MGKKSRQRNAQAFDKPAGQPELELFVAIDQCAFFPHQLDCIKALDDVGRAAGGRVRVTLLVTDMDYSEKTNYRDPGHIDKGLKKSDTGYKFAKYILSNRANVHIVNTAAFEHFMDVFRCEVLQKEVLGADGKPGLLEHMEKLVAERVAKDSMPLAHVDGAHPLRRFRDIDSAHLVTMAHDLKRGVYKAMKLLEGREALEAKGIHSVDDLSMEQSRRFLASASSPLALQVLHDSPAIYNMVVRTNTAYLAAKDNAGETSLFQAWDTMKTQFQGMGPAERKGFGKQAAIIYVSNDGDSLDMLARAKKQVAPQGGEVIPLRVMHANSFVKFLKGLGDDLSAGKLSQKGKLALEQLREAKVALNGAMPHAHQHQGQHDEGIPADSNIRGLFADKIGAQLLRSKFRGVN